jgi:hypothetical protein
VIFLFLLVTLCAAASAATLDGYHFRKTFEGWPETKVLRGMVVTREAAYRIEFDTEAHPRPYDAIVSKDGEHEIALNREHGTYFDLTAMRSGSSVSSALLRLLPVGEGNASGVSVRVGDSVHESLEGRAVRRTTVDFDYGVKVEVGASTVAGRVEAKATFWMTDEVSLPLPVDLRPRLQTGFPEVDAAVSQALAGLTGFPLKQELQVTSKPEGEAGRTERIEVVLYSFKDSECNAACFQVPASFLLREPQFSDPSVETRVVPAVPD